MTKLYTLLRSFGKVKTNEPMAKHTTFKIGGEAAYFVTITDITKLPELLATLEGEGTSYLLLGGGSNMLVSDNGFDGVVIEIKDNTFHIEGNTAVAAAGMITAQVAHATVKANLTGFEWGVGVPGTIGGAVRGNAGAMGKEMKDDVEKVEVYKDGEVMILSKKECNFGYRTSLFKKEGGLILRVWITLKSSESKDGMKKALEALQYRNTTQPKGFASTGCIFKNIDIQGSDEEAINNREKLLTHFDKQDEKVMRFLEVGKVSAGWLIEHVGLKGKQIGQAQISPVHGNFIVNLGGATASDVLSLIDEIKAAVYNTYGMTLEEEIFIVQ